MSLLLIAGMTIHGCASLGRSAGTVSLPDGAPKISEILSDLARNEANMRSFRGAGTFILESPEFDATKKFRGSIKFRRPSDLYVQGNHRLTGIPLFKLTCVGPEFLMEFPGSQDESFYQFEGNQYEDVPFSVSPSDVAREMFLPESWGELRRREARVHYYDEGRGVAQITVGNPDNPRRLLEVVRVNPEDPTWVASRNTRLADGGRIIAETILSNHNVIDGAVFPTEVEAWFPTEATRMTFRMRNVRLNTTLEERYFDIRARALELNLATPSDFGQREAGLSAAENGR